MTKTIYLVRHGQRHSDYWHHGLCRPGAVWHRPDRQQDGYFLPGYPAQRHADGGAPVPAALPRQTAGPGHSKVYANRPGQALSQCPEAGKGAGPMEMKQCPNCGEALHPDANF